MRVFAISDAELLFLKIMARKKAYPGNELVAESGVPRGSAYVYLNRLMKKGFAVVKPLAKTKDRARKLYSATNAGRLLLKLADELSKTRVKPKAKAKKKKR
jgi:DNA-binding PadR family transcriptional regulator